MMESLLGAAAAGDGAKGSAVRFSGSSATWPHCRGVLHVSFPSIMWTAAERYGGQRRPNALQQFKKKHFENAALSFVETDLRTMSASQYYFILFVVFPTLCGFHFIWSFDAITRGYNAVTDN